MDIWHSVLLFFSVLFYIAGGTLTAQLAVANNWKDTYMHGIEHSPALFFIFLFWPLCFPYALAGDTND